MSDKLTFGFYLGCLIPNRYPGIEAAMRKLAPELGIRLETLVGASCCPPPGVIRSFDQPTWLAMAARNLAIAENLGVDMITMCNGCYGSLKEVNELLKEQPELLKEVNKILKTVDREYNGNIEVYHIAEVLYRDIGVEKIRSLVKKPLQLNTAIHYGCHILRPSDHRDIDSSERPQFLDDLVEALGCNSIPYTDKMLCCGAGGALRTASLDVSLDIAREKLQNIHESGADCIVNICPFCHLQFDAGQVQIRKKWGEYYGIPVLYYLQLLGLSMGYTLKEMGLQENYNYVPMNSILQKFG